MQDPRQKTLINTHSLSSAKSVRKLRREREVERLRLQRKTKTRVEYNTLRATDFTFKDESRNWTIFAGACSQCGWDGQHYLHIFCAPGAKPEYSLHCRNTDCNHCTPKFSSSQLAIRHWKLLTALTK